MVMHAERIKFEAGMQIEQMVSDAVFQIRIGILLVCWMRVCIRNAVLKMVAIEVPVTSFPEEQKVFFGS